MKPFYIRTSHAIGPDPKTARCHIEIPNADAPTGEHYRLPYGHLAKAIVGGTSAGEFKLWFPNVNNTDGSPGPSATTIRIDVGRRFRMSSDLSRCGAEDMNSYMPGVVTAWVTARLMYLGWKDIYYEPWQVRAIDTSADEILQRGVVHSHFYQSLFRLSKLESEFDDNAVTWRISNSEQEVSEALDVQSDFADQIRDIGMHNGERGLMRGKSLRILGITRPILAFSIVRFALTLGEDAPVEILFEDPFLQHETRQGFLRVYSNSDKPFFVS